MTDLRWATVVTAGPVRIRLDGDTSPLPILPDSILDTAFVGQRVLTAVVNRRIVVLGGSGGTGRHDVLRMLNDFRPYGGTFASPTLHRTSSGIVRLGGLISGGTVGGTIAVLPEDCRPAHKQMFLCAAGGGSDAPARVDVRPDGTVFLNAVANLASGPVNYVSLASVMFPSSRVAPSSAWTPVTLLNDFGDYRVQDATWPPASWWEDPLGRVWLRGLCYRYAVPPGNDTPYAALPTRFRTNAQIHLASLSNSGGFGSQDYNSPTQPAQLRWKGYGTGGVGWFPLPSAPIIPVAIVPETAWTDMPMANGWNHYDQTGAQFPRASTWAASDGIQHIRGLIRGSTLNLDAAILPWVEPFGNELHAVNAENVYARNDLYTRTILPVYGNTAWRSLDGMFHIPFVAR